MSITLENTSKRMWVFNLDHESLAAAQGEHGPQAIKTVTVDHLPNGELYSRTEQKNVPASLTLAAGETRSGLPDDVQHCAQVKAALRMGAIRIVKQDAASPAASADHGEKESAR